MSVQDEAGSNDRVRRQSSTHPTNEIIAQSACEGLASNRNLPGWVYGVQRVCSGSNRETCVQLCSSNILRGQDPQTAHRTWSTIGAFHVYGGRPSSGPGTRNAPHQGLKVYYSPTLHRYGGCGANWCCCRAT